MGLIQIQKTGESFVGIHEPLLAKTLFDRVQAVLNGKIYARSQRHSFPFRRLLACAGCEYSLIGERQKGRVYYRCHSKPCAGTSITEDTVELDTLKFFERIQFSNDEKAYFQPKVSQMRATSTVRLDEEIKSQNLQSAQIRDRLNRLTDAYLDQALDKPMFEERKRGFQMEQKMVEENLARLNGNAARERDELEKFLEQTNRALLSYGLALPEEKREMVNIFTSNRLVTLKKLDLKPSLAFEAIVNRFENDDCSHQRDIPRTWDKILDELSTLNLRGELPDLSGISTLQRSEDSQADITNLPT